MSCGLAGSHGAYEADEVGANAIDGANALSFRSSDDSFYNVRDTSATDDTVSSTLNSTSAIAKAAAINDSTEFHGVKATATATVQIWAQLQLPTLPPPITW